MTIYDLKIPGARLPNLTDTVKCRVVHWEGPDQTIDFSNRVMYSFGTTMHNDVQYILAEEFHYSLSVYYMIPTTTIEKLAIEQGMIGKKELPKSFACQNTNQKLWDKYIVWLNSLENDSLEGDATDNYYGINKRRKVDLSCLKDRFDTILSLKEWNEIVNGTKKKTEKVMKNKNYYSITREQLKSIHNVACGGWKEKITEYAKRNPFGDMIEFTLSEIAAMFKASDNTQIKVLESIFGKQTKELNFVSSIIDFKVDGLAVFGTSDMLTRDAFIGLPRQETISSFFLNPDYNWELDGIELKVTRK